MPLKLSNAADEGFKNVSWNPTNKELKTQKRLQLAKDVLVDQACCGADDMKEGDVTCSGKIEAKFSKLKI